LDTRVFKKLLETYRAWKRLYWKWTDQQCKRSSEQKTQAFQKKAEKFRLKFEDPFGEYGDFYKDFVLRNPGPGQVSYNCNLDIVSSTDIKGRSLLAEFSAEVNNFGYRDPERPRQEYGSGQTREQADRLIQLAHKYAEKYNELKTQPKNKWSWVAKKIKKGNPKLIRKMINKSEQERIRQAAIKYSS
jgi:hypothetical protein